nr:pre-mRNA-splicing factor CWC22 homolog [Ipomoea batatas]
MDHPILPLPPPEPPAPENPPEKAPPKPHTCNDSAMSNFRALMMKMAIESSPSKSLTPAQTLILEDKLRQCFPYLRAPDHPPYAWMITTAIKQLNEEGGSSEEAISECIMNDNHDLPWAHSTLLKHHLVKLCEKREIVQTRDGLYVLNDRIASVPRVSIPSNPREFFDSTASPSCSLSISLASDSSSDSLYGGSSRRKGKRRRRKLKKARNTRKGRQQKGSARRGNNIHLKRKRKVQRRPPKKGKWKEEILSDEDTEDELLDIMLEEGMAVIRAENQLNEQKVTVEEELHPSEDINEDSKQLEMQEITNISPCESDRLDDNTQINAKIDVMEVQNPVVNEKMEVDIREQDLMQEDKQQEMQKKSMNWSCEKDSGEIPILMNEGDAQNPVFEARTDDIEAQNEQKEQEMMNGRNPLGLEHNANQLEMNAETKAMELQEGTVIIEEQNQEVKEEEHRDNQQEVRGEKNTGEENSLLCVSNQLQEQKLLEELHPLEEAKQGGNQPEMLEVSPSIPREEDSRHEIIQTNEDIEVIEVKDRDVEEQITGNPAQKEQEVMEESHQSPKMEIEDKQEDMDEKKRDWGCEKDVLSQEREARDLLLQDVDEGEHQPMQLDVMLEEENPLQLIETNDQLENANLVNDTKFQEMVDEGLKEHGCQEISHSPKNSSFLDEEHNKDFQLVNVQQSIQTEAEIVQDQNTEEINVLETTNEPEEGRCLRSGRKMKSGQKHEAVETSTGSEAPAHEETIDIKLNDQQEQETVACEEQSIEKGSSDEVEELSSPFQQNNEVSSEEEEQQELPFSEDTKQEQLSQRQLRPRVPKTEPGTQEHRIPQVVLSLEATRGVVTRGMAAATALDEQAPQQRKKRLKSQVGEISRMPRRSTRLSLGQSKKRVSRRRT